jgi:hypothetical protein
MSPRKRDAKHHSKARQRCRLNAQERLERDRRQAQRAAEALHQALVDLGLPTDLSPRLGTLLVPTDRCGRAGCMVHGWSGTQPPWKPKGTRTGSSTTAKGGPAKS